MVRLVEWSTFGFGESVDGLTRRQLVVDRRDTRVASVSDLYLMKALRGVLGDRWGAEVADPDISLYVGGCKRLTSGLIESGIRRFAGESIEAFSAALEAGDDGFDLLDALQRNTHPLLPLMALPNLDLYLAVKSFGIGGFSDHFTCEPWADVAAILMAWRDVTSGDAQQSAAAAVIASTNVESDLALEDQLGREVPQPSEEEGAVALLLLDGEPGLELREPLLSVSRDEIVRAKSVADWLGRMEIERIDQLVLVQELSNLQPLVPSETTTRTSCPIAAIQTLASMLQDGISGVLICQYDDAVAGLALG